MRLLTPDGVDDRVNGVLLQALRVLKPGALVVDRNVRPQLHPKR